MSNRFQARKGRWHVLSLVAAFACGCPGSANQPDSGDSAGPSTPKRDSSMTDTMLCASSNGPCYPACSKPEDCAGFSIPGDNCKNGYTCDFLLVKGRLRCMRFCVCKSDPGSAPPLVPLGCERD